MPEGGLGIMRYGQLNRQMHRQFNRKVRGVKDDRMAARMSGPGPGSKIGKKISKADHGAKPVASLDSLFDRYFALPVGSDDAVELLSEIRGRLSPRK